MDIYKIRQGLKNEMKGRFVELKNKDYYRFLELHIIEYDPKTIERLEEIECLESSRIAEYLDLLKEPIKEKTRYLYQLVTYQVPSKIINNLDSAPWEFNNHIKDYQKFGFQHVDEVLKYCNENWGVTVSDFQLEIDTLIP